MSLQGFNCSIKILGSKPSRVEQYMAADRMPRQGDELTIAGNRYRVESIVCNRSAEPNSSVGRAVLSVRPVNEMAPGPLLEG